jgi:hypothetical protein
MKKNREDIVTNAKGVKCFKDREKETVQWRIHRTCSRLDHHNSLESMQ